MAHTSATSDLHAGLAALLLVTVLARLLTGLHAVLTCLHAIVARSFGAAGAINPVRHLLERASIDFPVSFGRVGALTMPLQATQSQPKLRLARKLFF